MIEQLYTARGSQGGGVYYDDISEEKLNADPSDWTSSFLNLGSWASHITRPMYKVRPLWSLEIDLEYLRY